MHIDNIKRANEIVQKINYFRHVILYMEDTRDCLIHIKAEDLHAYGSVPKLHGFTSSIVLNDNLKRAFLDHFNSELTTLIAELTALGVTV